MRPPQECRNAAASYLSAIGVITGAQKDAILRGKWDAKPHVLWFFQNKSAPQVKPSVPDRQPIDEDLRRTTTIVDLCRLRQSIVAALDEVKADERELVPYRPTWKSINKLNNALKGVLGITGTMLKNEGVKV